jgi:hypothetical protein
MARAAKKIRARDFTVSGGACFRSHSRYIGGFSRAALK